MDPVTQSDQTPHLEQLALAELDVANRQLADAGRTIDELRADVLALASRVDAARSEAESFRHELEGQQAQAATLRAQAEAATAAAAAEVAREQEALRQTLRGQADAAAAAAATEQETLRQSIAALEAHIGRLKEQVQRPGRLMVKKALRRGQYAKPGIS